MTAVGSTGVPTNVVAYGMRCCTLIDVHTVCGSGHQSETRSTVALLEKYGKMTFPG